MTTMATQDGKEAALQEFYATDRNAQLILDYFANRERNQKVSTVHRLMVNLSHEGAEGSAISRGDIISIFKKLEELGYGDFKAGRHGHESRFEWHAASKSVGQVAAGERTDIEEGVSLLEDDDDDAISDDLLEHRYLLRPDLSVQISLPADLNFSEAKRLSNFIMTLPFTPEFTPGGLPPEDFSDWEK